MPDTAKAPSGRGPQESLILELLADSPEVQALLGTGAPGEPGKPTPARPSSGAPAKSAQPQAQTQEAGGEFDIFSVLAQLPEIQQRLAGAGPQAPQAAQQPELSLLNRFAIAQNPQLAGFITDRASGGAFRQQEQENLQFQANQQLFRDAFGGAIDIARAEAGGGAAGTSAPKSGFFQDSQRSLFFVQVATSGENKGQPEIIPITPGAKSPVGGLFETRNPTRKVTTPEGQQFVNITDPSITGAGEPGVAGGQRPRVFRNRASDASVQQRAGIASLVDQIDQVTIAADTIFEQAERGERGQLGAVAKELAPTALGDVIGGTILAQDPDLDQLVSGVKLLAFSAARAFESGRLSDQDVVFKLEQLGRASNTLTKKGLTSFKRKMRAAKRQMIVNMKIVAAQRPELFTEPGELEAVRNMPLPSILETKAPRDNDAIMAALEAGEELSSEELDIAEDLLNASEQ